MIPFNDIKYSRVDYNLTKKELNKLINKLKEASTLDEAVSLIKQIIKTQNHIEEMRDYAEIKNMRNSSLYEDEIKYWNQYKPKFNSLFSEFYDICLNNKYKDDLKEYLPPNFFYTIEYKNRLLSSDIIELEQEENELKSKYRSILQEKTIYNNEYVNLRAISTDFLSSDRKIRKKAHDAYNDFFLNRFDDLSSIFYDLVIIRNKIAKKLGFDNYSTYSLYDLRRFNYNYEDIKKFRNNVTKYIKPLTKKVSEFKKSELGIEKLKYYDTIIFKEMPKPLYKGKELLDNIYNSLKKLDTSASSFYKDLLDNGYIDLEYRENKVNFSITNYLCELGIPTITGNFTNRYTDIFSTTHEFGHAYQKYNASIKDNKYIVSSLLKYPTFEIAEMFSQSMELLTLDYVDNLFNENDYKKYCLIGIINIINAMPYICLVDEFQETVYKEESLTKDKIHNIWLELSKKYGLEINNSGHENLEKGGYFYRQSHIFLNPFYYIDYALSFFGAISLWSKCKNNLDLIKEMGSVASYYPFKELIKMYNISDPFNEETVKEIIAFLDEKLMKYIK